MPAVGTTPTRAVIAEDVRDLQSRSSHGWRRYGAGGSSIRHYAAADVAVSLRLMRAFDDIASTTQHADLRTRLLDRARRVAAGCAGHLPKDDLVKLQGRLATLETAIGAGPER
jgi:hypothetical protein